MMLMMSMVIKMMLAITMVMRMTVMTLLNYLVGQRHRKPGRELEGFWQTAVEPSWGKNRYHCIHIHAIIDSHHHGSHVIIMITITTTIIVQVFLFLTLPFHRLRISPLHWVQAKPDGNRRARKYPDDQLAQQTRPWTFQCWEWIRCTFTEYGLVQWSIATVWGGWIQWSETQMCPPLLLLWLHPLPAPPFPHCTWEGGRCNHGQNTDFVT